MSSTKSFFQQVYRYKQDLQNSTHARHVKTDLWSSTVHGGINQSLVTFAYMNCIRKNYAPFFFHPSPPLLLTWTEGNNILLASIQMKENYCLQSGHKLLPTQQYQCTFILNCIFSFPSFQYIRRLKYPIWVLRNIYIHSESLLQACLWEDEKTKIVMLYLHETVPKGTTVHGER